LCAFSCFFSIFHERHEKSRKSTKKQTRGFPDVLEERCQLCSNEGRQGIEGKAGKVKCR